MHYSIEEWEALPYWQSRIYLKGLEEQGIIGDKGNNPSSVGGSNNPGQAGPLVDYAEGTFPPGFKTRRAG